MEFSNTHPVAAPMLRGPTPDPDVERLLEGVAFLNALLYQKLDDEFPEIIHGLMDVIFPHYLRPIPSLSIVMFEAKPGLKESIIIPKGTSLSSIPVDGTSCIFKTCFEIEVHPLKLTGLSLGSTGEKQGQIRMTFELTGQPLSQWRPKGLSFLLGGTFSQAQDLFALFYGYLKQITVAALEQGRKPSKLGPEHLIPLGFEANNTLLPFSMRSFSGFRLLQEYFAFPSKFLFMELRGWEKWQDMGEGNRFEVTFDFYPSPIPLPSIGRENIVLFAVPVINLFNAEAEPAILDHHSESIRVNIGGKKKGHFRVYSVEKVIGFSQGNVKGTEYYPLEIFTHNREESKMYQVTRSISPIDDSPEVFISFPYIRGDDKFDVQTLSIYLTCTNGRLPEKLRLGDISVPTSNSPELINFHNIIPPTLEVDPQLDNINLWKFLSHLSLNYLSIADIDSLKEMLRLYIFPEARDRAAVAANLRKLDGISQLSISPVHRLIKGNLLTGNNIQITADKEHFAGLGGLYLFGSVLDRFFSMYCPMHTFIKLSIKESITGEIFTWPERMGTRLLI
ncbi:MAG: type VI secretion system baseplate subunit TssF [Syntrophorhabdaceae bacterium]|nr:type VI secretion system baseplate subunit TssF [Syntrophorhabdaceae bacterium]